MPQIDFCTCLPAIARALREPLPGPSAQLAMGVTPRSGRPRGEEHLAPREGAVLILLYPTDGEIYLPLTRRSTRMRHHGGQISLPGGTREPADVSLWNTALREAWEEISVPTDAVAYVGALTPLDIPISRFSVHPFIGRAAQRPAFAPGEEEVDELIELPLSHLLAPESKRVETWDLHGREARVPFYRFGDAVIWGATAMILSELEALLRRAGCC